MHDERVADALIKAGALRFALEEPFVLVSRKIAPIYVDVRQLTTTPVGWKAAIEALAAMIKEIGEEEMISGGELGDLFFSIPVALELGKPHLAIRKAPKGYGVGGRLVGTISEGQRTVHVSDLITSGTSALDWVAVVKEFGGRVAKYVAVLDRNQGGGEALKSQGVELFSLLTLNEGLLNFASDRGAIGKEDLEKVRWYLSDPEAWAKDFLLSKPGFLTERIHAGGGRLVRSEGIEILLKGYPELVPELGDAVRAKLRVLGVDESVVR